MKAKRLLPLLLAGAMAVSAGALAACTPKDDDDNKKPNGGKYTVDAHEYHLVGNGGGDLEKNNWSPENHDLMFVRDETADHNVFKVTIDMYANDAFKILDERDSYDYALTINCMYGLEDGVVADGEGNPVFTEGEYGNIVLAAGQDGTYTFSLHTYPDGEKSTTLTYTKDAELDPLPPKMDMYVVTDLNDFGFAQDEYLANHMTQSGNIWKFILEIKEEDLCRDENGAEVEEGAVYLAVAVQNDVEDEDGVKVVTCDTSESRKSFAINGVEYNLLGAGTYTLKYDAEKDTLTIIDGIPKVYFCGTMTDWDLNEDYLLTEGDDGIWRGTLEVADSAKLKIRDNAGGWYSPTGNDIELDAGEWLFTYNPENNEVKYEKFAYYIAGTLFDEDGNAINFSIVAKSPKLTLGEDGLYTVELVVTDVTDTSDYGWIKAQGKDGIFGFQVVYGTVLGGVKDWHNKAEESELYSVDGNVFIKAAGTYTITYDPATETISVAVVEDVAE